MQESTKLVHAAIDRCDAEDYHGAIELLTRAITANPKNAQAFHERGMALLHLNKDADAIADFDKALALEPYFPGSRDWRARALVSLGRHADAAAERLRDLRANPNGRHEGMGVCPLDYSDCAESFVRAGDKKKAVALLEEYFEKHASGVTSYVSYETAPMRALARLRLDSGDTSGACSLALKAYKSKHRCPADVVTYALTLEAAQKYDEARTVAEEALRMNGQMAEAIALRSRLQGR